MTAILVHAAWADASNWSKVLLQLRGVGVKAVAPQIPLTSLSDDVAALRQVIDRTPGPVMLAAHSYGGAVITAAGTDQEKVRALLYIAAMVPEQGETVAQLLHRAEPHPLAPALAPDANGNIWMSEEGFANAVAPESSEDERFLMAAARIESRDVDHSPTTSAADVVTDFISTALKTVLVESRVGWSRPFGLLLEFLHSSLTSSSDLMTKCGNNS